MSTPKPPSRWCDTCEHLCFRYPQKPCTKGHSPRYYQPKGKFSPFGYRRLCDDFTEAALQPMRVILKNLAIRNKERKR